jgi:hypothetical protein
LAVAGQQGGRVQRAVEAALFCAYPFVREFWPFLAW